MLYLIAEAILAHLPAPLHRIALRGAHRVRKAWWRVRRPSLEGCRILALDEAGRVLLVRHSYGSPDWMPPGGGMKRGEDPIRAALRELFEELGCGLTNPRLADVAQDTLHGAGNKVHIVIGQCLGTPRPDLREITHAVFFAPDDLPEDLLPALRGRIEVWVLGEGQEG
ncbi:NUDIX domain-containing protein [Novosphingobium sediminicola]|uniref:8-oxo-dGTP pyrophosphatase MutT (NUDIX family) n=1 Tax=Novosphingobium sediminicola TaxID=563162 RepID=A0A7W6CEG6_9SPHN|nr:NUDIX domain-containing protein [Novosphingobium sediminicola]MBB3955051.1 8-oxo-dGTP pyrophosphatase MutT (NUDIX family) [Novosphingobium sediminicola]